MPVKQSHWKYLDKTRVSAQKLHTCAYIFTKKEAGVTWTVFEQKETQESQVK